MCFAAYYIPPCECRIPIYLQEDIELCINRPVSAYDRDPLEVFECPFLITVCCGVIEADWCPACYAWLDEEPEELQEEGERVGSGWMDEMR